ncbi:MAG: TonB-dependent receptor, partial [Acidobacteria bacterium]|nr:TonB-dependent receptor [Acidobacteriota bacterium]
MKNFAVRKLGSVGVSLFVLLVLTSSIGLAQEYRGRIQGTVADPTGAVVPAVPVTLINNGTNLTVVRQTGEQGTFLFDLVEPGTYTVSVEMEGFNRWEQTNLLVENRGDVTVHPVLQIGAITETVTVTEAPVQVKFNTTSMEMTMDNQMVKDLPIVARNPFTLTLLNPAVDNKYFTTRNPFFMWAASSVDVGGPTTTKNDVLVDGMPVMLGPKGSYAPTMDATTEVTVQQNSVDSEYGHSAGGILNVSMKSGTNDPHGTLYYFGRNPKLNAVSNPLTHTPNLVRNHIEGGSFGWAPIKNRIFHFAAFEKWAQKDPRFDQRRMMTPQELGGDFSNSLNISGGLRTIYDPWTSMLTAEGAAIRTPFANNMIPASRIDPASKKFLGEMWGPNGAGSDITGTNNFQSGFTRNIGYHNLSNRGDFVITENLKTFFRFSRFRTTLEDPNWTPNNSRIFPNANGGVMHSLNISGDMIYTLDATTVLNIRGNYTSLNDDYDAPEQQATLADYAEFFPANDFYSKYLDFGAPFYFPGVSINGFATGGSYGKSGWWFQHPQQYYTAAKLSKQKGRHYLKTGFEFRTLRVDAIRPRTFNFAFNDKETADTFIAPNTKVSGDGWASFLLGALDPGASWGGTEPFKKDTVHYYGAFIQDDFKMNQNVTLNLGLRYEYESAIFDRGGTFGESRFDENRYSRPFDLTSPIPEFQGAGAPQIPAQATALMDRPYLFNGAWQFASADNRGMWDPRKMILLPRAGIALRLNDAASLRIGWARYNTPASLQRSTGDILGSTPVSGFSATTPVAPNLVGVPQQALSNPFPVGTNPIVDPAGQGDGRYTNLGGNAIWDQRELVTAVNDRFNVSLQKETFNRIIVDATYFFNMGRDLPYNLDLNLVNPAIINAQGTALSQQVANSFFQRLPLEQMRGPLRSQRTVALRELLKPYQPVAEYPVFRRREAAGWPAAR